MSLGEAAHSRTMTIDFQFLNCYDSYCFMNRSYSENIAALKTSRSGSARKSHGDERDGGGEAAEEQVIKRMDGKVQ